MRWVSQALKKTAPDVVLQLAKDLPLAAFNVQ
jgi:hypothetical protein